MKPKKALGFTLLEVMIAVVILAIGLSSLFTSEAGAIRIAQRARTTTIATLLARCKMAEIEEKVSKGSGWPTTSIDERDECCEGGEHDGFRCEWKVERIKLPDVQEEGDEKDGDGKKKGDGKAKAEGEGGKDAPKGGGGILDQLVDVSKGGEDERMSAITDVLSGGGATGASSGKERGDGGLDYSTGEAEEGVDPIGSMVMGMAFPVMKPAIEEGVRRASVRVLWKEGDKEQEFELTQFLVSEQQLILPEGEDADGGVPGGPTPPSPTPPGTTPAPPLAPGGTAR